MKKICTFFGKIHQSEISFSEKYTFSIIQKDKTKINGSIVNKNIVCDVFSNENLTEDVYYWKNEIKRDLEQCLNIESVFIGTSITLEILEVEINSKKYKITNSIPMIPGLIKKFNINKEEVYRLLQNTNSSFNGFFGSIVNEVRKSFNGPHDTGFHAYRAIEIIRDSLQPNEKIKKWEIMHKKLNTKKEDLEFLTELSKSQRHGSFIPVSSEDREKAYTILYSVLAKYIEFILSSLKKP